jgi:hypothetical protein
MSEPRPKCDNPHCDMRADWEVFMVRGFVQCCTKCFHQVRADPDYRGYSELRMEDGPVAICDFVRDDYDGMVTMSLDDWNKFMAAPEKEQIEKLEEIKDELDGQRARKKRGAN